jgi:hypothetical protein
MAKCGCAGGTCSCVLTGGTNVQVTGTGSSTNPYVVSATGTALTVVDTPTIDLTLTGEGTSSSPLVLSGAFVGEIDYPDMQPSASQSWSGAVNLTSVTGPRTIRATLTGNVTSVTMPTWSSSVAASITLILAQDTTGGRTWVMPGTSAFGIDIILSTAPLARDLVVMLWTGVQWIAIPSALDVS